MTNTDWDVVIAGAGPTGLTLANHQGTLGVRTLVIEKLPELIAIPVLVVGDGLMFMHTNNSDS